MILNHKLGITISTTNRNPTFLTSYSTVISKENLRNLHTYTVSVPSLLRSPMTSDCCVKDSYPSRTVFRSVPVTVFRRYEPGRPPLAQVSPGLHCTANSPAATWPPWPPADHHGSCSKRYHGACKVGPAMGVKTVEFRIPGMLYILTGSFIPLVLLNWLSEEPMNLC